MRQKLHDADFDPSTSDLYVMMHALDSSTDKNILITEQLCSYAVRDWVLVTNDGDSQSYATEIIESRENNLQIKVMERVEDNFE